MSEKAAATGLEWKGYEGQDYENFWVGPGRKFLDELERSIVRRSLPGGEAIIEIGAGFGRLGQCYVDTYKKSFMVEPANNLREIAKQTYGTKATYWETNVYDLPFPDETFDAALMVRVFHHLAYSDKALKELHRVLKPGGRIVFNYSNKRNFKRIAQFLIGRAPNPFSHDPENYNPALIGHHPSFVKDALQRAGFTIDTQYGVGISDKLVESMPVLGKVLRPSVPWSRLAGMLKLSPAQFVVGIKQ